MRVVDFECSCFESGVLAHLQDGINALSQEVMPKRIASERSSLRSDRPGLEHSVRAGHNLSIWKVKKLTGVSMWANIYTNPLLFVAGPQVTASREYMLAHLYWQANSVC
jgi:hypothetical protein